LLVAIDAAAEQRGLRRGLGLAEARAMHPDLVAAPEDAAADARLLDLIADWCQRYTPLVTADPPDGILLDIGGCAHLFNGESALAADLARRLAKLGFASRIAMADTIGAAWAAARYGRHLSCASGQQRALLAPLPLVALRLPAETVSTLARVGLKRIADIVDLPRAPLAARFGPELLRQLDRALGCEHEPLTARLPLPAYAAERLFAEPIAREEDVLGATERLAAQLKIALERRHEGARQIELALFRTDGMVQRITAGTSRPLRNPREIRALFVERLAGLSDPLDPGFGFDLIRLSVLVAEPCPPEQIGLRSGAEDGGLDRLIDRLSARLGARRVTRLLAHDSHIPELACSSVPAQTHAAGPGWDSFRHFRAAVELAPRPLRLLAKPEPIEALAMVPDGPPLRFRWRRALHEVVAAEGPERIEGAWWSNDGPARDYFRVEDQAGLRFWLFRLGLYRNDAEPRWFLHGMFA
jgi:protein ImuB